MNEDLLKRYQEKGGETKPSSVHPHHILHMVDRCREAESGREGVRSPTFGRFVRS